MWRGARLRGRQGWIVGYATIQAVILAVSATLPARSFAGALNVTAVLLGLSVFTIEVARRRPTPVIGWALVAAGVAAQLVAGIIAATRHGLGGEAQLTSVAAEAFTALSLTLVGAGLSVLSWQRRNAATDVLDSAMFAIGGFLLAWTLLIAPQVQAGGGRLVAAVVFAIGALLALSGAFKLVLAGGLRDPALRLLLVAVAVLLVATLAALIPAIETGLLRFPRGIGLLWAIFGALLGGAGLHPGLTRSRVPALDNTGGLSPWRVGMFVLLALLVPAAITIELVRLRRTGPAVKAAPGVAGGVAIMLVAAAVLLLLLVIRMSLIARTAQRRANELAQRSAALAEAMSRQEGLQQQLTYQALHDPLTRLSNRTVLVDRLDGVLRDRRDAAHALLMLDLDGFKDINDTWGHPVGDDLLVEVAIRLSAAVPSGTLVARLGGDEFAVLLQDTDQATAWERAEALLDRVRRPFVVAGREVFLSTSIGLLMISGPGSPRDPSEALRDADLALYAAKAAGKSRVVRFEPELRRRRVDHTRIAAGLRHAVANHELALHYQPMVSLESGRVVAVEALLRWLRPEGPVDSATFLPVAEEAGLIAQIGAWALRQACRDARRWYDHYGVVVSVNVAARQLDEPDFVATVLDALTDAGLAGQALVLELTEACLATSVEDEALRGKLDQLRDHGVRIAVDDFGSGFTSLSYVASLPIDVVKVDRTFTQHRGTPATAPQTWALTRAVLQLIDSLNLYAVAEGIETRTQAEAVRSMRFPFAQGFLFAYPVPAEEIDRVLAVTPAAPV